MDNCGEFFARGGPFRGYLSVSDVLFQVLDGCGQLGVHLYLAADLIACIEGGGVVASDKASDVGQREFGELGYKVNQDLPCPCDLLGFGSAQDLVLGDAGEGGYLGLRPGFS